MNQGCCRTCLGKEKSMYNINSSIIISGEDVKLSDILENFYSYKVSDDPSFPEKICINCTHQLTVTYSFKILIENSLKTLTEKANFIETSSNHNYDCSQDSDDQALSQQIKYKKRRLKSELKEEITSLFCVECKAEFASVILLNKHCSDHHPVKRSIGRDCEYCSEKFEDFHSLVLHRRLHLRPYLCENCWEGFYTEDSLQAHTCAPVRDEKKKDKKYLCQCDQCGKSYPPGYIKIHLRTHSTATPYSCKYCPKKFKVPGGLHSHVLWNHKRTRNYKCEVCNATFISSSARSSHIRKNHLKETKYSCDSCGKRFFSKSELQRHTLTHTGVKNFHCHLCDKSYQTRYGLNVHLKSHSQITMNVLNL